VSDYVEAVMTRLTLEFSGGLEALVGGEKVYKVDIPQHDGTKELLMREALQWIKLNLVKERPDMFIKDDSVRPGVLVLIDSADWELSGKLDSPLDDGAHVVFISTLHGG